MEVEVRGIATPQTRRFVARDESVEMAYAVADAPSVLPGDAGVAHSARQEHLDGHAVADPHVPPTGRGVTDRFDDADDLVSGNVRIRSTDVTRPLLVISAAQTTRL